MTLGRKSRKRKEIKMLRIANEHFCHRRHRLTKKNRAENNIEKKKRLEEIKLEEIDKELNKILNS